MAIVAADIKYMLSTKAGTAGNSLAQADPNASLGKYVSTTEMGTALHSLFDVVSGAENAASEAEYRCVFVKNGHATLTLLGARVFINADVAGGAVPAIALDSTAKSDAASATAQALEVANEDTAPAGPLTFSTTAVDYASGLVVGDLAPNQVQGIWIRRTTANTAALNADGTTLNVTGDTAA